MKVSRRSWHYRYYNFLTSLWGLGPEAFEGARLGHRPLNLCRYFWQTVLISLASIVLLPPIAIVVTIAYFLVKWWIRFVRDPRRRRLAKRAPQEKVSPPKAPKDPSLVSEYLKARKQKACPMIELVD